MCRQPQVPAGPELHAGPWGPAHSELLRGRKSPRPTGWSAPWPRTPSHVCCHGGGLWAERGQMGTQVSWNTSLLLPPGSPEATSLLHRRLSPLPSRTSLPCAVNPWTRLRTEACGMTPSAISKFLVPRQYVSRLPFKVAVRAVVSCTLCTVLSLTLTHSPGGGRASGTFRASVLACAGVSMAQTRAGDHPLPCFHDSTNWGGRARAGGMPRVRAGGHAGECTRSQLIYPKYL
uniref:Uncharacterized protein n=1 Tax=Rhinopithecus roxellana TaxID=61622 RepID=A0A2K6R402_RHIRO